MKTWRQLEIDDPIYILKINKDYSIDFTETKFMGSTDGGDYQSISYFDDEACNHHWTWNKDVDEPSKTFPVYNDDLDHSWVKLSKEDKTFYCDPAILVDDIKNIKGRLTAKIIYMNSILRMFINADGSPKI